MRRPSVALVVAVVGGTIYAGMVLGQRCARHEPDLPIPAAALTAAGSAATQFDHVFTPPALADHAEIVIDLDPDAMLRALTPVLAAAGWEPGDDSWTPHRATLVERGRAGARSYELVGVAEATTCTWAARLAAGTPGRVACVASELTEWTAGAETIRLLDARNATFHGGTWADVAVGRAPVKLPEDVLEAFGRQAPPEELVPRVATALYGAPGEPGRALLTFHRAYDDLSDTLAPIVTAIHARVARDGAVTIGGLATFRAPAADSQLDPALVAYIDGGGELPTITIDPALELPADAAAKLTELCRRMHDGKRDLLLGDGLLVTVLRDVRRRARNPGTGEITEGGQARVPMFLGW